MTMSLFADAMPQGLVIGKPSNEWYTPSRYIEAAREVMGRIDLDPASCELANKTVQATRYYSKEDDGGTLPWYGNVWLNPPYSETGRWTNRAIGEYRRKEITQAVITVNVSSDTYWYQALCDYLFCLVHGRIDFDNPVRNSIRPRFPSAFFYLGPNEQRFIDIFSQFGRIVRAIDTPRATLRNLSLWESEAVG